MEFEAYKEIHGSHIEMKKTISVMEEHRQDIVSFFEGQKELIILGCGSSYWASLSMARSFSVHTDMRATALKAAEVAMAPNEYIDDYQDPVLLLPSRSGESKELLEAIAIFKQAFPKIKIFAITEFEDNSLEKIADVSISIPFVEEISVCQTRSFNCLYTAMAVIVSMLSDDQLVNDFKAYLDHAETYYEQADKVIAEMVKTMENPEIVVLSSGIQYGAAIEGAYIIMEMAQRLTNYFQTLEYRHGPIVTANANTYAFIIATDQQNLDRELQMAKEIAHQGAKTIICGCEAKQAEVDHTFTMEPYCEEVRGIYGTMILQHLAYHLAIHFDRNPDKPGDLVKFITY